MVEIVQIIGKIRETLNPKEVAAERKLLSLLTPVVKRVENGELTLPLTIAPQQEPQIQGYPQGRRYSGGKLTGYSGGSSVITVSGPVELRLVDEKKQIKTTNQALNKPVYELVSHWGVGRKGSFSEASVRRALSGNQGQESWRDEGTTDGIIVVSTTPDRTLKLNRVFEKHTSSDPDIGEFIIKNDSTKQQVLEDTIKSLEAYRG